MRIALAGAGAFGIKHLDGLADDRRRRGDRRRQPPARAGPGGRREVRRGARRPPSSTRRSPATTSTPSSSARRPSCTRRSRSRRCGPASTCRSRSRWPTAGPTPQAVDAVQQETGLVCMVGHTRRFNPSHQWIHQRIAAGELVDPADGRADLLLPPHQHERARASRAAGPTTCSGTTPRTPSTCSSTRPASGSRSPTPSRARSTPTSASRWTCRSSCRPSGGKICTLSLSFNNDGPLGTFFRYICDNGTYIARYDDLVTGKEEPIDVSQVDVSMNGIELQDREFVAAIREGREPNSSVATSWTATGCSASSRSSSPPRAESAQR